MGDYVGKRNIEVGGTTYQVQPLHQVPSLADECCDLINLEWKRSHAARLTSIGKSSENFPMSLVLLKNTENPRVVGHCKISRLGLSTTKVFIETVVIHPDFRGKGLGKFLMNEAETVCKGKSIRWIYLSTKDKEIFYEKLGYVKCPPVNIFGCQLSDSCEDVSKVEESGRELNPSKSNLPVMGNIPPPPPLPKPVQTASDSSSSKVFMRKEIIL